MTMKRRILCSLILSLVMTMQLQITLAQTSAINTTVYSDQVRFSSQDEIREFRVEALNSSGRKMFDSGFVAGQTLDWNMLDQQGEPLLEANFTEHFGGRNGDGPDCSSPFAFICGSGRDATFGSLSEDVFLLGGPFYVRVFTFASGTLTICGVFESVQAPGGSGESQEQNGPSYGNPTAIAASYAVCGGTGVFAGASGGGTEQLVIAGDHIRVSNTGILDLAN